MRTVQIVLTDDQALLIHGATAFAVEHAEDIGIGESEVTILQQLSAFMALVGQAPERFPVVTMSSILKQNLRRMKGPAQTTSRKHKRKARQERRQSFHKRRRKERAATAAAYNEARAKVENEIKEALFENEPVLGGRIILPPGVERQVAREYVDLGEEAGTAYDRWPNGSPT